MSPRWLAIWLVDWPIQRLRNEHRWSENEDAKDTPVDAQLPIVLWREDSRRGRLVTALCDRCRAWGLKAHQPLHEATDLLLRRVSDGTPKNRDRDNPVAVDAPAEQPLIARHDPLADLTALRYLADQLQQRLSPLVAIEPEANHDGCELPYPQTLLLDVTGIGDWFGDEAALLEETQRCLTQWGLKAKVALTGTAASAWAMAHFAPHDVSHLGDDSNSGELDRLPTRALRLDATTAHQLDRLGLKCIADVLQLPRAGLASRLGSELLRRIDEFMGDAQWVLTIHQQVVEESAICSLEYPTFDRPILEHRMNLLVRQVADRLSARRRGALRLLCEMQLVRHAPVRMEVALFVPTADHDHLYRLMVSALERLQLPCMVERLTLSVMLGGPLQQYQPTMFADDSISQVNMRRSLARLVETLAGRLGRASVCGIQLTRDPLPEAAYRGRPLVGEANSTLALGKVDSRRNSRAAQKNKSMDPSFKSPRLSLLPPSLGPLASEPARRPLRLFASPMPLEVIQTFEDGIPRQVRFKQRTDQIVRYWGPERIETGWWNGPQVRRDYYRVELASGVWWWLFKSLGKSAAPWHLHGIFG